jgi:CRP/FNR family transcriptional regulator, dissimilatory nitrate respiration regulator
LNTADLKLFRKSWFFRNLPASEVDALAKHAKVRVLKRNQMLRKPGQRPKEVFVILTGRIAVFSSGRNGEPMVIDILAQGAVAGIANAFERPPAIFSMAAVEESRVLSVPLTIFRRRLLGSHKLAFAVAEFLASRWHFLARHVRDLKQLSSNQRLCLYLLSLTDKRSGPAEIQLPDDQLLLAGIIGTTRESLSRAFAQLRRHGVDKRGRFVRLQDIAKIRAYCEG